MTTIQDVARLAGVSPVTVSRVINGAANVNAATRARVEEVIREVGYAPNMSARSLRSRQTFTLALIVPDITNAFWTTIARGVEDAAQNEGYSVLLCNSDEDLVKQSGYIEAVYRQRVDGVAVAPFAHDPSHLARLKEQNIPTVLLDRWVANWDGDSVRADSLAGAYALTNHLLSLGYRRIAVLSGPVNSSTGEERIAGYALALDQAGIAIDPGLLLRGGYSVRSGLALASQLLGKGAPPQAILAANNQLAVGVLDVLRQKGLRMPMDIALVCFDDLPDLSHFYPFLTLAAQPAYEMGMNAGQLLVSRIRACAALPARHLLLPVDLKLRYSCGRFKEQFMGSLLDAGIMDRSETVPVPPLSPRELARLDCLLPTLDISTEIVRGWGERCS